MLLANLPITTPLTASTTTPIVLANGLFRSADVQANFTYGSGGTTATAWVQTSLDGGATWVDTCAFGFTTASKVAVFNLSTTAAVIAPITPTDGSLAANTAIAGIVGNLWRVKLTTTGTYSAATRRRHHREDRSRRAMGAYSWRRGQGSRQEAYGGRSPLHKIFA
jgi:hypothetical protein